MGRVGEGKGKIKVIMGDYRQKNPSLWRVRGEVINSPYIE
jgi:hypothetical protein